MGRIPRNSYRLSCRIYKRAGERLEELLGRISYGKKKPMGKLLSRLVLKASEETWQEILKEFPPKPWAELTKKEQERRIVERQVKAAREESSS